MKKIINKYLLTESEMYRTFKEVCLIFIDKNNKILVSNENGIIDVPRFIVNEDEFDINEKVHELFSEDFTFDKFMSITDYRYKYPIGRGLLLNQKAEVEYYKTEVDIDTISSKYRFLSIPNIKYVLGLLNHKFEYDCISDELDIVLDKLEEEYSFKPSVEDYKNYLLGSFIFEDNNLDKINKMEEKLKSKNPYLNYDSIFDDTLYFLDNFCNFTKDISNDHSYTFRIEKYYPIEAFSDKLWYSDILILLGNREEEVLVSLYLIKAIFKNKLNIYLKDDILEIKEKDKVLGVVELLPKFIIEDKEDCFRKTKKLTKNEGML